MDELEAKIEALIESNAAIRATQLEILASQQKTQTIVTEVCEAISAQIPMLGAMFGEGGIGKMFGM